MTIALKQTAKWPLHVRHATKQDAREIARLFLISSDGLASYIWGRIAEPGQALAEVGAARYARTGTAFSFENCLLVERQGETVGMAHAFPMPVRSTGEIEDDPVLAPYAELEDAGSMYLSGLAVDAGHRNLGIGGDLMDGVERLAVARCCPRVSLICFEQNKDAMRFYRRRGYREIARRPLVPHPTLRYAEGDALLLARDIRPAGRANGTMR